MDFTRVCAHCGQGRGWHQFGTDACPADDSGVRWLSTKFQADYGEDIEEMRLTLEALEEKNQTCTMSRSLSRCGVGVDMRYIKLPSGAIIDIDMVVIFKLTPRGELQITTPHGLTYLQQEDAAWLWPVLQGLAQQGGQQ